MVNSSGMIKMRQWKRRRTFFSVISALLISAAFTCLVSAVLYRFLPAGYLPPAIFILSFLCLAIRRRFWHISDEQMVRHFNRTFPGLEDSAQLLLRAPQSLNMLEKLQRERTNEKILALKTTADPTGSFIRTVMAVMAAMALSYLVYRIPVQPDRVTDGRPSAGNILRSDSLPPEIRTAVITIRPPAYTGKKSRSQNRFQIRAEAGSGVTWNVQTTQPVRHLYMLLNNKERISFTAANTARTRWVLKRQIGTAGFYQLDIGGKLSDLYQVEVIADQAPRIRLTNPAASHTVIDFGMPEQVSFNISVTDDYGLAEASLIATVASGKGESVDFREHRLSMNDLVRGSRKAGLRDILRLKQLGMKPGDELYFYASATDNRNQVSRTDIYTVTMADTAELMSIEGLSTGVNLMPEYFRSQRQIIIDTEKLLKERDTLGTTDFRNRSNNLGMDQKLLRLRYGKFLGEESESEVGEDSHGDEDDHPPVRFGDPASMIDAVSHKHDNSEDATFFEPAQKAQLKAVLTEMWKAELQLRTFKPQAALPFEYKALRLLKDLQQKSRAYVGKTGIRTPPLKPEKRLTGELEKVRDVIREKTEKEIGDPLSAVRKAVGLLEEIKSGGTLNAGSYPILQEADRALNRHAIRQPGVYLQAVRSMQRIMQREGGKDSRAGDVVRVQAAFYRMLREAPGKPAAMKAGPRSPLSEQYFRNLNNQMN